MSNSLNQIYGDSHQKNPTAEDMARTFVMNGTLPNPQIINFSDLRVLIKSLQIYNFSPAFVGIFLSPQSSGDPDFIIPPYTLTTLSVVPTQYITIAFENGLVSSAGSVNVLWSSRPGGAGSSSIPNGGFTWQ